MRAVILAGGKGRRLAPLTNTFPKALAPVGDLPIIDIVLRQLRYHGVREVIVSLGHLGELIQAYFATRGPLDGLAISYVHEAEPLGTAGPLSLVEGTDDDLLVVNGDEFTTFDFASLIQFHRDNDAALTVAVHKHAVEVALGVVEIGAQDQIIAFTEKPILDFRVSMGINVYSSRARAVIRDGEHIDFPDVIARLLEQSERVVAYETDCYWLDIGQRDDYERAQRDFAEMRSVLLPGEDQEP